MTKTSPTDAPRGFSNSAWQALERAAATRRSAATVLRLLARLAQPLAPAASDLRLQASRARLPVLEATDRSLSIGAPFEQWAALTDAYAEQFLRMQRGDPRARDEAMRLSREMLRMNEEMSCMG
jgi:hypothetical protein